MSDATLSTERPWVAIQRNRTSGAGRQYRAIRSLIDGLKHYGIRSRLYSNREELDRAIDGPMANQLIGIVAAGGDGTLMDVINRHPDCPLPCCLWGPKIWWQGISRSHGVTANVLQT